MPDVTLKAAALGHHFGTRMLFRRLSLTATSGEVVAVAGANGVGKSTLLMILGGVLRPVAGSVSLHVDGKVVDPGNHSLHVGCVAPGANVYDDLTAFENLQFVARIRSMRQADARISATLETVGLAARAGERVRTYSSGMKQRMKVAVAILAKPPVLLLDEPSINMDADGHALCKTVVEGARACGSVVVIASNTEEDFREASKTVRIEDYCPEINAI